MRRLTHENSYMPDMQLGRGGHKFVMVDENDTDVVVIAISLMPSLMQWVSRKCGLDPAKGSTLGGFLSMTLCIVWDQRNQWNVIFPCAYWVYCDAGSGFNGKGEKTAWKT